MKLFTLLAVTGGLFFYSLQLEKADIARMKHRTNKCNMGAKKIKCPYACKGAKLVKYNS